MKQKIFIITLLLAISGIMCAVDDSHEFYIGRRLIKKGEVLTPQNFGSVIKAGKVELSTTGRLTLDNAVIEYDGSYPALQYLSSEILEEIYTFWPGVMPYVENMDKCDINVEVYAGNLHIIGECSITNTGTGYGIEVKPRGDYEGACTYLSVSGEKSGDSKLTVRSNHSNAIYLYGRKSYDAFEVKYVYNTAAIAFEDIAVNLYAPNGCAIRGRQNKNEYYKFLLDAFVNIPEPCKDGAVVQCLHSRYYKNKYTSSFSIGNSDGNVMAANTSVVVDNGSIVNEENGRLYTGPLMLGRLGQPKLSEDNLLMVEGETRKINIIASGPVARRYLSYKASSNPAVDYSINGHTLTVKAKSYAFTGSSLETYFMGRHFPDYKVPIIVEVTVPLYIANKLIPVKHAKDIGAFIPYTYSFGGVRKGKLSYDRVTNTLTMDNVTLHGYRNSVRHAITAEMPLTIYLKGNNIITDTSKDPLVRFKENTIIKGDNGAKLTMQLGIPNISFEKDLTIEKGVTLDLSSEYYVIRGGENLNVAGTLKAYSSGRCPIDDVKNMKLNGTAITTPKGGYHNGLSLQYADGKEMFNGEVVVQPVAQVVPVSGISVKPRSVTMNEGEYVNLSHTILPANATNKNVRWSSSNPELAVVNSFGRVWARKAPLNVNETVRIRVKSSGSPADDCYITIKSDAQAVPYNLSIAGISVTSHNASDIKGPGITGKVSYDVDKNTLTLQNATIRIASGVDESAIAANQTLNIHMIGNNEIVHAGSRYGIENTQYDLIFKGAKNSKLVIMNNYDPITYSGIFSDSGGVSFLDDCNVQIISADNGIRANSIDINQNSKVRVKSTNAGFSTPRYALNTQESIKVNGASTLEAIGKSYAIWVSGYGLTAYPGAELREGTSVTSYEIVDRLTFTDAKSKPYVLIHPSGTGLESLTSQGIRVWGDKGVIKIVLPDFLKGEFGANVQVYNITGALVRTVPLGGGDMLVANIPAGIYIVRIGNAAEKVIVK